MYGYGLCKGVFPTPKIAFFSAQKKTLHFWYRTKCLVIWDVSKNNGTPKSSILIGFSIINNPFWGAPFLETPIWLRPDLGVTKCVGVNLYEIQYQAHGVICTINLIPLSMTARGGEKICASRRQIGFKIPQDIYG